MPKWIIGRCLVNDRGGHAWEVQLLQDGTVHLIAPDEHEDDCDDERCQNGPTFDVGSFLSAFKVDAPPGVFRPHE